MERGIIATASVENHERQRRIRLIDQLSRIMVFDIGD